MITYKCINCRGDLICPKDVCGQCVEKYSKKPKMAGGMKHDQDKPQMELISSTWIEGVAAVLTFGAKKYAAHNWRKGIAQSRLLGATLRHLFAYSRGEDLDPETGLCHLYHASCCIMFASELRITHPELDDRWKQQSTTKQDQQ
jgi:Domain of unknown function (DUF5664)